jgi:hypothetical protein
MRDEPFARVALATLIQSQIEGVEFSLDRGRAISFGCNAASKLHGPDQRNLRARRPTIGGPNDQAAAASLT